MSVAGVGRRLTRNSVEDQQSAKIAARENFCFKLEKETITIKTRERLSYIEAKQ